MNNTILELTDVNKVYPEFQLKDISMSIPKGKIVGIIGENGAGKTTLISLILNQIPRSSGKITIFGKDNIRADVEVKKKIGFVVDECCFHPCLTPKNIMHIMASIYSEWDNSEYIKLINQFHLNMAQKIDAMSKGMKAKLMLAVALSHGSQLLILDEITSGLDPVVRDSVLNILSEFVNNKQNSVIFSSHITSDLEKIADYVGFIHKGNMVFFLPMDVLKEEYKMIKFRHELPQDFPRNKIVVQRTVNNEIHMLVRDIAVLKKYISNSTRPSLDEIMLMYIMEDAQ